MEEHTVQIFEYPPIVSIEERIGLAAERLIGELSDNQMQSNLTVGSFLWCIVHMCNMMHPNQSNTDAVHASKVMKP